MSEAELHKWVADYNWDDSLAPIWPIADSPQTPYATALMIYWRLGGPWLGSEADGVNAEARRLQDTVRGRLLAGFYTQSSICFDPAAELSRVQIYQLRKSGLPELLLGSGSGTATP
jgi:hypothetical protein